VVARQRRIAFSSSTTPEDIEKTQRRKNPATAGDKDETVKNTAQPKKTEPENDRESDAHIISGAVYRDNDEGYLDPKRHEHIWVLEVPTTSDELAKSAQLTSSDFDESEVVWTQDGQRIYFLSGHLDELLLLGGNGH
jgi:WD40-like Beta Propeller Repeat